MSAEKRPWFRWHRRGMLGTLRWRPCNWKGVALLLGAAWLGGGAIYIAKNIFYLDDKLVVLIAASIAIATLLIGVAKSERMPDKPWRGLSR